MGQQPIAGTSIDVLAQGSRQNGTALRAGLTFAHDGLRANGRVGMPIDGGVRAEWVIGSSKGRVPSTQSVELFLRLYTKLF